MVTHAFRIFVCYRRGDSNAAARGVWDRLNATFGQTATFLDHLGFEAGGSWRTETASVLAEARAVVVLIGRDWLSLARERCRDPDDPVRRELELARADPAKLISATSSRGSTPTNACRPACSSEVRVLWDVFRSRGHQWDVGAVTPETMRHSRDWQAWTWRRSTVLLIDYAVAVGESLETLFDALCFKADDPSLPPLRLLPLEREADANTGWFQPCCNGRAGWAGVLFVNCSRRRNRWC